MNINELRTMQNYPLELKIAKTKLRIREFIDYFGINGVYISFSGGKDSTVLAHLVHQEYPTVPLVFANTGLEFPELVDFTKYIRIKKQDLDFNSYDIEQLKKINKIDNLDKLTTIKVPRPYLVELRPQKSFKQVLEQDGYPVISKKTARMIRDCQNPTERNAKSRKLYLSDYVLDEKGNAIKNRAFKIAEKWRFMIDAPFKVSEKCCDNFKKKPFKEYEKETGRVPFIGTMAEESKMRESIYLQRGCNSFEGNKKASTPMGFWTEQDVLEYIVKYNLEIAPPYGKIIKEKDKYKTTGESRTGCVFCMFGMHLEEGENRFQRLERTHPQLHSYCMNTLGFREVCEYIGIKHSQYQGTSDQTSEGQISFFDKCI